MSPAARTLQALRASGYVAGVVERYIFQTKTRVDLFGCVDIIAARRGQPILAVQATTLDHIANRLAKARGSRELAVWLAAGGAFEVWGWDLREWGRPRVKRVELRTGDVAPRILAAPARRRRRVDQPGLFDALAAEASGEL
jgi:hypothetical protein